MALGDATPAPGADSSKALPALCVEGDISKSSVYKDICKRYEDWLQPSTGLASKFSDMDFAPDGKHIVGIATICKELKGHPATQLGIISLDDGKISTFGDRDGSDMRPKWSKDGKVVSFLSEIKQCNQLHLLDVQSGQVTVATDIQGNIEQQTWSQDGQTILLTVAGLGADVAGVDGGRAFGEEKESENNNSWMPSIETAPSEDAYRTLWHYTISSGSCKQVSPKDLNIWQAVYSSDSCVVGICSDDPGEEYWYHSTLREISLETGAVKEVFTTDLSMEWLSASPDGKWVAFAVGLASDRQLLTGDLHVLNVATGQVMQIDSHGINVNWITWADDNNLVAAGLQGFKEVIFNYDMLKKELSELWSSEEYRIGSGFLSEISSMKDQDGTIQCAFIRSGWFSPPTLGIASSSGLKEIKQFTSSGLINKVKSLGRAKTLRWKAPDGLEILGYLLTPHSQGPHPTVLHIHGGPVWGWRPNYLGAAIQLQVLLEAGFAVFQPNPRGSWGRGKWFSEQVFGDMGGLDTHDYISGIDFLVQSGDADPKKLGTIGTSYGGYMSAWLISQTDRFAAAVSVSPVTDWVSEHLTSNLGRFCQDFLADDIHNPTGKYFSRSPIHHVRNVNTPTFVVSGGLDKNCPPSQGIEFHRALVERHIPSAHAQYPKQGHGIPGMPETIDLCARSLEWFRHYLL